MCWNSTNENINYPWIRDCLLTCAILPLIGKCHKMLSLLYGFVMRLMWDFFFIIYVSPYFICHVNKLCMVFLSTANCNPLRQSVQNLGFLYIKQAFLTLCLYKEYTSFSFWNWVIILYLLGLFPLLSLYTRKVRPDVWSDDVFICIREAYLIISKTLL